MPRYTIVPADQNYASAEITAIDGAAAINVVSRLQCKEADVFEDGLYKFSLRVDTNGLWCIFRREVQPDPVHVSPQVSLQ